MLLFAAALFVVALDDSEPSCPKEVSEALLLGTSSARWFDKHQLIVFKNGVAGEFGSGTCAALLTTIYLTVLLPAGILRVFH